MEKVKKAPQQKREKRHRPPSWDAILCVALGVSSFGIVRVDIAETHTVVRTKTPAHRNRILSLFKRHRAAIFEWEDPSVFWAYATNARDGLWGMKVVAEMKKETQQW